MRTIGILGGMSWESTEVYYRLLNEAVRERLGGLYSAQLLLYCVDFADIRVLQQAENWEQAGRVLGAAGHRLAQAGAEFLLLATNTMHIVADAVEDAAGIPLLHIADATAEAVAVQGIKRVILLGTEYTMRKDFYKGRLQERFGLEVLIPSEADMRVVDRIIFDELCLGRVREDSRLEYVRVINELRAQGGEGVILGCTEIGLLVEAQHCDLPLFDSTALHAAAAVERSLQGV